MSFNKLTAYTQKVADAADTIVGNAPLAKSIFDAAPEELRTYFNKLIDALKNTTSGDSGAKNLGATSIADLTGTDVQSLLESLKTYSDGKFVKNSGRTIVEGLTDTYTVPYTQTTKMNITINLPQSFKSDTDITSIQITPVGDVGFIWFLDWAVSSWTKNTITLTIRNTGYADGYIRFSYHVSGNM